MIIVNLAVSDGKRSQFKSKKLSDKEICLLFKFIFLISIYDYKNLNKSVNMLK